ncbi:hypothetical protein Tco_1418063 [Tanacetum coccineum]
MGTQRSEATKDPSQAYFMAWMMPKRSGAAIKQVMDVLVVALECQMKMQSQSTNADDVDLIHEDLDQIDDLDLEEMDINWQIAMTAIKIKKFYKKTGRRPRVDGKHAFAFE